MERPSAPISPVPSAPSPAPEPRPQRTATLPRAPALSDPALSSYVIPAEEDTSAMATAHRARRAMRKVDEHDDIFGHYTRTLPDGTLEPATGLCKLVEDVRGVDWQAIREVAEHWTEQKAKRAGLRGYVGERGTALLDKLLIAVLLALLIAMGWGKYIR